MTIKNNNSENSIINYLKGRFILNNDLVRKSDGFFRILVAPAINLKGLTNLTSWLNNLDYTSDEVGGQRFHNDSRKKDFVNKKLFLLTFKDANIVDNPKYGPCLELICDLSGLGNSTAFSPFYLIPRVENPHSYFILDKPQELITFDIFFIDSANDFMKPEEKRKIETIEVSETLQRVMDEHPGILKIIDNNTVRSAVSITYEQFHKSSIEEKHKYLFDCIQLLLNSRR